MSDNPCMKPALTPISADPVISDCEIPASPPPFNDCSDLDIPDPAETQASFANSQSSKVLPVKITNAGPNCTVTFQFVSGSSLTPIGSPQNGKVMDPSCCVANLIGSYGWAAQSSGSWLVSTENRAQNIPVRLTSNFNNQLATAEILRDDGSGETTGTGQTVTVVDPFDEYNQTGNGMKGWITCSNPSNTGVRNLQITRLARTAQWITFTLNSRLNDSNNLAHGTLQAAYLGPPPVGIGANISIKNELKFSGEPGAKGYAVLGNNNEYHLFQLTCPGQEDT